MDNPGIKKRAGIYWLASYPKSGNTWFRLFLSNYLYAADKPIEINKIRTGGIASSAKLFDDNIGVFSSDLCVDEISDYRADALKIKIMDYPDVYYLKIHDSLTCNGKGKYVIPLDVSLGAVYLIRNPLDIVASFANHNGSSPDEIIDLMADKKSSLSKRGGQQLRQLISSWSVNVESWLNHKMFPVMMIKYEDMLADAEREFTKALEFMGIALNDEQMAKAIEFSDFDFIKEQENAEGFFREAPAKCKNFFRQGQSDNWKYELDHKQIKKTISCHGEMMKKYGYLNGIQNVDN